MTPFLQEQLRFSLTGKKILLGITGSIAAFKACDLIRFFKSCGAQVRVVLSHGAENFVTRTTLETLSGEAVLSGFWDADGASRTLGTHHIETARWADLILVAPATANLIAKLACGLAEDLLSTEILAAKVPVAIAPAMNPAMFSHPAVQENLSRLGGWGVKILGPASGPTSCGEVGLGRMLEPLEIVKGITGLFRPPINKKVVVTLGPTLSPLDPVRYLTNRSSGKMGASLCWAAEEKGYSVTAICGPTRVELPSECQIVRVQTATEMLEATQAVWPTSDLFIANAAVLDWDISNPSSDKMKKENGFPQFDFVQNPDILAWVSKNKTGSQYVLGFAAETSLDLEQATAKLKRKGCDSLFVNQVSGRQGFQDPAANAGFESDFNAGTLLTLDGPSTVFYRETKAELARKIFASIEKRLLERPSLIP